MAQKLCLNVGCGDRTYDFYPTDEYKCINFDTRPNLKRVDEVGDVRNLSRFTDEMFDFILASDIIEHFPITDTPKILKEWRRVLKNDGIIEFRLPNLKALCEGYVKGKHTAKLTSWLLFGGQDYPGNFHYVCFDRELFKSVVEPVGFIEIEYKDMDNNFEAKYRRI